MSDQKKKSEYTKQDCPFCNKQIINSQKIFETEKTLVLINYLKNKNLGRCLIIPKRHVASLKELTNEERTDFFTIVCEIANKISEHYKPLGINYGVNEGQIAGQTVFHLHLHIIPRYENDGLLKFHLFHEDPKLKSVLSDQELKLRTAELRKVLSN